MRSRAAFFVTATMSLVKSGVKIHDVQVMSCGKTPASSGLLLCGLDFRRILGTFGVRN